MEISTHMPGPGVRDADVLFGRTPARRGVDRLADMIQARRLTKEFFKTEEFTSVVQEVDACLHGECEDDVWFALSVVRRAASVSKPSEKTFLPLIERRLSKDLPTWRKLDDGEDRYYLAKSLQYAPNERIVDLAFAELAREDVAEKARRVWAELAFDHASSLTKFLTRLNEGIVHAKRTQNLTVDALVRRIRRIDSIIAEYLATSEKPIGLEFGSALQNFYAGRAIARGPVDRDLRNESAEEFVQSLTRIVRLNEQAAKDPSVYSILNVIRRWWRPASPSARFEVLSRGMARVGVNTLHMFARQGVRNAPLRSAVERACGKNVVEALMKSAVEADPSLPENVSYWLVRGVEQHEQKSTDMIDNLSGEDLDDRVARLLISVSSPDANHRALKVVADQVNVLMPNEASSLERTANRLSEITQWSRAVARSRHLELGAERRGDVVVYDPIIHDGDEDCIIGSKVVVMTQGVVRKVPGHPSVLVSKAAVMRDW